MGLLLINIESSEAMGLSTPLRPMVRSEPAHEHEFVLRTAAELRTSKLVAGRINCIAYLSNRKILFIYLADPRNQEILKITKKLRGGDLTTIVWLGLFVWMVLSLGASEAEAFAFMKGWGLNRPDDYQPPLLPGGSPTFPRYYDSNPSSYRRSALYISKPSDMPQQQFSSLTRLEKRSLPDVRDMQIDYEGYPKLDVGYWQAEYKVRKHGAIHNLEYSINPNTNATITNRTESNALAMMQSIVDMPNRDGARWILNGTYQGGTKNEFEAIHIYDPANQIIAVFKKETSKFVTTCQLTPDEATVLETTGNFGGAKDYYSKQAKNLPPVVYNRESNVTGMTPISQMDASSSICESPNIGFTPINTFESDITNITPRNDP